MTDQPIEQPVVDDPPPYVDVPTQDVPDGE